MSEQTKLPTISLPTKVDVTDSDVDKAGVGNFLDEEGTYKLTVKSWECDGPMKNDSTWFQYIFTLASQDGKEKKIYIGCPTERYQYGDGGKDKKGSLFAFKKLRDFLAAFGLRLIINETKECAQIISTIFPSPDILVGKVIEAELKYPGPYLKRVGQEFTIINKGDPIKDVNGEIMRWPNRDAADNYATLKNLSLSFLEIISFTIPEKPTVIIEGVSGVDASSADFE